MAEKEKEREKSVGAAKSGVLIDLGTPSTDNATQSWPRRAARDASTWLESLLGSVDAWLGTGAQPALALGPYVIEQPEHVYGEGGYGRVLRGLDTMSGEQVAIKELQVASSERRRSAVVKEVAILRRLTDGASPHVIAFKGYFERGEKHYIVMEACTGGELFDKVAGGDLPSEDAGRGLFAQLVAGVRHAHDRGVAHRDLKLENVLADADGALKLADFGLAHLHRARAGAGGGFEPELLKEYCGSKSYCPPEMLAAQPYDAFVADVWSLGVCLFALLAGFFPFEEAGNRDWRFTRAAKLQAQPGGASTTRAIFAFYSRPCPFSAELVTLLDAMLAIEPARRLDLQGVAASTWLLPPDQRPAGPPPPPPPPAAAAPSAAAASSIEEGAELDLSTTLVYRGAGGRASVDEGAPLLPPLLSRQKAKSRVEG